MKPLGDSVAAAYSGKDAEDSEAAPRARELPLLSTVQVVLPLTAVLLLAWLLSPTLELPGLASYLPLHTFMEAFAIAVAVLVFAVGWNACSAERASNIILLSCAFLAVALLDFGHSLSYPGMPDFITPSGTEKAILFWLAARFLESAALLAAAAIPWRSITSPRFRYALFAGSLAYAGIVFWLVLFHQDALPRTFVAGHGLTPFKIGAEYTIIAVHLVSAALLLKGWRRQPAPFDTAPVLNAILILSLGELYFTLYRDVTDAFNLLGHIYKILGYLFIYKAVFVDSVREPYQRLRASERALWREKERTQETLALLKESEERYRRLVELSPDAIAVHSGGRLVYVNPAGGKLLGGKGPEDLIGRPIFDFVHPDYLETVRARLRQVQSEGIKELDLIEEKFVRLDGQVIDVEVAGMVITYKDRPATLLVARDITGRKRAEAQLDFLANHDALTGLYNRHRFQEELARFLTQARDSGLQGAVLFLDVDQFKYVNDSLGHQAGDRFLVALAGMLRACTREHDIVARWGGDEFTVLMPRADAAEAQAVAEEILQSAGKPLLTIEGHPVSSTVSIGIALFPEHGRTVEDLLAQADTAMYRAKEEGRNSIRTFTPDLAQHVSLQCRLVWTPQIREALEQGRFVLHLQPIRDLRRNRIVQYEALLRMVIDEGRLIPPAGFLDIAERFGLMRQIDRWVVRRAIRLIAEQQRAGRHLRLSVNLSGGAFADPKLLPLIRQELIAAAIDPSRIVFEITESAAIANIGQAQQFILALKDLGCRFALDDFGAGFSSFNHLKQLPVDYLKIDGSFIRDLPHDPVDQQLVRAMAEAARGLGKKTVAEFVGDADTVRLLRALGVDYAQGYHIGEPAAASEVLAGPDQDKKPTPFKAGTGTGRRTH